MKLGKLIIGVGIGTVIGLLIAPKKGSELIEDVNVKVKELTETAKELKKEDVVNKLNEAYYSTQKAIQEFDSEKFASQTKEKLENLSASLLKLKQQIVDSEQFNTLVGTFNHIANTLNDKVDEIVEEINEEVEEKTEEIDDSIDQTSQEIEDLIKEMTQDQERGE